MVSFALLAANLALRFSHSSLGKAAEALARFCCDAQFFTLRPYWQAEGRGTGPAVPQLFSKWARSEDGTGVTKSQEIREGVGWHAIGKCMVSASRRGGFVIRGGEFLHPPVFPSHASPKYSFPGAEIAGILGQRGGRIALQPPKISAGVEKGVFVGSMAPHNWYHWNVDTLPSVWALRTLPAEYDSFPVLLPEIPRAKQAWFEALSLCLNGRDVVWCDPDRLVSVENLVVFDGLTSAHPRVTPISSSSRVSLREEMMANYRQDVLAQLGVTQKPIPGRRYFLGRRAGEARGYNQNEIWKILEKKGFTFVFLDSLTYAESVELFAHAELLAGPHGAGWAGLLFSPPQTRCVFWGWEDKRGDNWYENLAGLSEVSWQQVLVDDVDSGRQLKVTDPRQKSFYCDPDAVASAVDQALASIESRH